MIKPTQIIHVSPPTLAARLVTIQACAARKLAESAEPPLKPVRKREVRNQRAGGLGKKKNRNKRKRTKPSKPQEYCAEDDVARVMWLVGETFGAIAAALTEVDTD